MEPWSLRFPVFGMERSTTSSNRSPADRSTLFWIKGKISRKAVKVSQVLAQQTSDQMPLIGDSEPVRQLRQMILKVAPTEATVLISGENGTGKEMVATEIFRASGRSGAPFIKVNCAAISETLIES